MSGDRIEELLREVADDVQPGDRLDAILDAADTGRGRRQWWVAGSALVVAASVVTALALAQGGTPRSGSPDPSDTSTAPTRPPTGVASPTVSPDAPDSVPSVVAIYYAGDTPSGPRLYREFRSLPGDPLTAAVSAAVGRDADDRPLYPLDPDYQVAWPSFVRASAALSPGGDLIEVDLSGDPQDDLHDRSGLTPNEARIAVEAVVRTAQAAVGERLPVQLLLFGERTDQVLGVPASEPLDAGSDLAVLSHVSLTDPSQGLLVDNDDPFTVSGVGNSFEGTVVVRIQRWEGTRVVDEKPTIAGWQEDRLFPFEITFDLRGVAPGDYVVVARTDDPSGQGLFDTDTRVISIVDCRPPGASDRTTWVLGGWHTLRAPSYAWVRPVRRAADAEYGR